VVDVQRRRLGDESVVRRCVQHEGRDAQSTLVVGRRDLPSRGLPPPLKRCRVTTPDRAATVHCDADEEEDWNKENRRREDGGRRRRRRCECESSSRCAQSPDNHVYQTLEPPPSSTEDQWPTSPIYETIDCDNTVSTRERSRHTGTAHRQPRHESTSHKTNKRVTFNVSILTRITLITTHFT